jgi:hypothetical protein
MLPMEATTLPAVLDSCPEPVLRRWLAEVRDRLDPHRPDPQLAARVFLATLRIAPTAAEWRWRVEYDVLIPTLPRWAGRHRQAMTSHLDRSGGPAAVSSFVAWRERWDHRPAHRLGRAALRMLRDQLARVSPVRRRRPR